jgi:hypothetical protein
MWNTVELLIPAPADNGISPKTSKQPIMNGILYAMQKIVPKSVFCFCAL